MTNERKEVQSQKVGGLQYLQERYKKKRQKKKLRKR